MACLASRSHLFMILKAHNAIIIMTMAEDAVAETISKYLRNSSRASGVNCDLGEKFGGIAVA